MWHEGLDFKLRSVGISGVLYNLLGNYFSDRFQSVILNGQKSSWRPVKAGVPQGSILGPLLFLVYINDLPNELKSSVNLFADDTSLFTIVKDKNKSANTLNNNLFLISKWAYYWKMLFNTDPSKPAQEMLFSRKKKTQIHPTICFNNIQVERASHYKHLGILLDEKLNFKQDIDTTGDKTYEELGLESLKSRRWYKRLSCMFKIMKEEAPNYLINLVPKWGTNTRTRNKVYPL